MKHERLESLRGSWGGEEGGNGVGGNVPGKGLGGMEPSKESQHHREPLPHLPQAPDSFQPTRKSRIY